MAICYLGAIASFQSSIAYAQTFTAYGDGRFVLFDGPILSNADVRFQRFLDAHSNVVGVRLHSSGGVVVASVGIANEVARRRLSTFISEEDECASACAIVFFAGHDRLVRGRLGVHQMDDRGRANASALQFVLADVLDAFERFGVHWEISQKMLTTPPSRMYWIPRHEIEKFSLNRDLPDDAPAASPRSISTHEFADYPTTRYLAGSPQIPDFAGTARDYRYYRTRLTDGARAGVNFAGHYRLIEIGCGTSCRFAYLIDLRTGEISPFPYGGEEQYQMKLLYSPDSRLVKARWTASDDRGCIEEDLSIEDREWVILERRSVPKVESFCDY